MSLDLIVRGATVVDGLGTPRRQADIGVRNGLIAMLGQIDEEAARTIDADGLIVAPGFIDVHTHYDAQVWWDPTFSPSPLHGITTLIAGNCGFSLAPLDGDESADYVMRMLAYVEGMPLESLRAGAPWDWRTFREYLERIEGSLAVNAGFMVGHSTIRRNVMGSAATQRHPTADELSAMRHVLHESLAAGAMGFSSSWAPTHFDGDGNPVPSRCATIDELVAMASVCADHVGTSLEFVPGIGPFDQQQIEAMAQMSASAKRPLNWNTLRPDAANRQECLTKLQLGDYARAQGGKVVALSTPRQMRPRHTLLGGFSFGQIPDWASVMTLPAEKKLQALSDPAIRQRLGAAAAGLRDWAKLTIVETFTLEMKALEGQQVGDIAGARGVSPFNAFLDIACVDKLRTAFSFPVPPETDEDWAVRREVWADPRVVLGASDAGAHLDLLDHFNFTTAFLQQSARERGIFTVEEAVHLLTDVPARLYGLRDRGRVVVGAFADLVIFDETTIGTAPSSTRFDLPAGAGRLYSDGLGIHHVIVNGTEVVTNGSFTDSRPGRLLRSGVDTYTPSLR